MEIEIFDLEYIDPIPEAKLALIKALQAGDVTLSFSSILAFSISPAMFIAYKLQETKTTPAMLLGNLVHCMVLEPDQLPVRYFMAPNVDASTAAGKNAWGSLYMDFTGATLEKNKAGNYNIPTLGDIIAEVRDKCNVTIIPYGVWEQASFRARKLVSNLACRWVLNQITNTERKVTFDFAGLNFRGVIDGFGPGIIADIKNVPDATLDKCTGAIWKRCLHWQAFGYDRALGGGNTCYILAVDGNGETSVHAFGANHLDSAQRQLSRYCHYFKSCVTESLYNPGIWDMSQDFWLRSEMNVNGINFL